MTGIPTLTIAFPHAPTIYTGMMLLFVVCVIGLWHERERLAGASTPAMKRPAARRRRASDGGVSARSTQPSISTSCQTPASRAVHSQRGRKMSSFVKALRRAIALSATIVLTAVPTVDAAIVAYGLDTSGSMRGARFDAACSALVRELQSLAPGDVAYVIAFDVNERRLGRIAVTEDGTAEGLSEVVAQINALTARGLYTNLDEVIDAAKVAIFEDRTPGDRRIVIVSDGLSDPDRHHQHVDLAALGQMVPQTLGVSLFLIGLSEDLARLFGPQEEPRPIIVAPEFPHIAAIPFDPSAPSTLSDALSKVRALPVVTVTLAPAPTPTDLPRPSPSVSPTPSRTTPSTATAAVAVWRPADGRRRTISVQQLVPWVIGSLLLAGFGASVPFLRPRRERAVHAFVLDVTEPGGIASQTPIALRDGDKVAVGPRGDVTLSDPDLPAVVLTITSDTGLLWLTPLDSVSINGQPVTRPMQVGVGDAITVRDTIRIRIDEGADE